MAGKRKETLQSSVRDRSLAAAAVDNARGGLPLPPEPLGFVNPSPYLPSCSYEATANNLLLHVMTGIQKYYKRPQWLIIVSSQATHHPRLGIQ